VVVAVEVTGPSSRIYDRDFKNRGLPDGRVREVWRVDCGSGPSTCHGREASATSRTVSSSPGRHPGARRPFRSTWPRCSTADAMRIAITGANGHVGANLARLLLEEGHQLRLLIHDARTPWRVSPPNWCAVTSRTPPPSGRWFAAWTRSFTAPPGSRSTATGRQPGPGEHGGTRTVWSPACGVGRPAGHFSSIHT